VGDACEESNSRQKKQKRAVETHPATGGWGAEHHAKKS